MALRIVTPQTVRIALADNEWILVRKRLSAGDVRKMYARMMARGATPDRVDPLLVDLSRIVTYLVDWSAVDAAGQPIAIRDLDEGSLMAILDLLEPDDFKALVHAIDAHEHAEDRIRDEEKKTSGGDRASLAISQSPASMVGATSG